jgi:hypothetical protein
MQKVISSGWVRIQKGNYVVELLKHIKYKMNQI